MDGGIATIALNRPHVMNAMDGEMMRQLRPVTEAVQKDASVRAVAGAGFSLMCAADLAIAAADTRFTLAYANIGVSPDGGSSYFLPRLVGYKKTTADGCRNFYISLSCCR